MFESGVKVGLELPVSRIHLITIA